MDWTSRIQLGWIVPKPRNTTKVLCFKDSCGRCSAGYNSPGTMDGIAEGLDVIPSAADGIEVSGLEMEQAAGLETS